MIDRKRIGEILQQLGVLSRAEVDRVLAALRRRGDFAKFGQVAKDMGLVQEEQILAAIAVQMELIAVSSNASLAEVLRRLAGPIQSNPKIPIKSVRGKLARRM